VIGFALLLGCINVEGQLFTITNGTVNTCSGLFYDSGGPVGNYGDNENFIYTICPDAGSGSGDSTMLEFNTWSVQPGGADELNIYDGDDTSAPLLATGNGTNTLAGQLFVATPTNPTGCLTFEWTTNASGTAPGWEATLLGGPNAGQDAVISTCTDQSSLDLFAQLGGTPDPGGTWRDPSNNLHSNIFNPAVDPGGMWTYTVAGSIGCNDATATVSITLATAPNAGTGVAVDYCETDPAVNLFTLLGGSPDPGGVWTGPNGAHNGILNPGTDVSGLYTYTVMGTPPCSDSQAQVDVTILMAPDAGTGGALTVCSDDAPFSLFDLIGGNPDIGGVWLDPNNVPHPVTYSPGVSVPGNYTYLLVAQAPCVDASSIVSITENQAPDAGISDVFAICSDDTPFSLLSQLGGTPDATGIWSLNGSQVPAMFDPSSDPGGLYTYTVAAAAPCVNAVSTLDITVNPFTDAGTTSSTNVCSNDASFQLIGILGGTPQLTGTWQDPNGDPHSGTFTPGASIGGDYTYTVEGIAPCVDDVAIVTVNQTVAPNAGNNESIVICSDEPSFNLFDALGGSPDVLGGTWEDPNGDPYNDPFDPAADVSGVYTYTVAGQGPCSDDMATVSVIINQAPNAGTTATIDVCSDETSFDLITILGGTPDMTGNWEDPNGDPFSGIFDPLNSAPGVYTYTVLGIVPCVDAIASVTVGVTTAPEAGLNNNLVVCSDDPIVPLFNVLAGTPDNGGQWFRPNGNPFNGNYNPASNTGGLYTYVVEGTGPCENDTATVQIIRNLAPRAGTDGTITVCSTQGQFSLRSVLGGNPMNSGTWTDPNGVPVPSGNFVPGLNVPGFYTYVVPGVAPCVNDSSLVEVIVNTASDAGNSVNISICGNDEPFNLFDQLQGTPDAGGTWDLNGAPHSVVQVFIPKRC